MSDTLRDGIYQKTIRGQLNVLVVQNGQVTDFFVKAPSMIAIRFPSLVGWPVEIVHEMGFDYRFRLDEWEMTLEATS